MLNKNDLIFIACAALVLAMTRPTAADVEAEFKKQVIASIQTDSINKSSNFVENFTAIVCKLNIDDCYKLLRATVNIEYRNIILLSFVSISDNRKKENCVGALTKLFCPKFLN